MAKKKKIEDLDVEQQEATEVKGGFSAKQAVRRQKLHPRLQDPAKPAKDKFLPEPGP